VFDDDATPVIEIVARRICLHLIERSEVMVYIERGFHWIIALPQLVFQSFQIQRGRIAAMELERQGHVRKIPRDGEAATESGSLVHAVHQFNGNGLPCLVVMSKGWQNGGVKSELFKELRGDLDEIIFQLAE